MTDSKNQRIL